MQVGHCYQHIVFKRLYRVFIIASLFCTVAMTSHAYAQCNTNDIERVVFHGDSIAQGMYNSATSSQLNGALKVDAATSGASFVNGFEATPNVRTGDLVIISYGANDVGVSSTSSFRASLLNRVQQIKNQGACVVLMGTSSDNYEPYSAATEAKLNGEFDQAIEEVAGQTGSGYFSSQGIGKAADGLHYTSSGYTQLVSQAMSVASNGTAGTVTNPGPPPGPGPSPGPGPGTPPGTTPTQTSPDPRQLIQQLQNGEISVQDAAGLLQSFTNIDATNALEIMDLLQDFSPEGATDLLEGFLNDNLDMDLDFSELEDIQNLLEQVDLGNLDIPSAEQLLENLNLGINAEQIEQITNLLETVQNGAINMETAQDLLSQIGLDINTEQLEGIVNTLENLMDGNINLDTVNDLLEGIGEGLIPPELAEIVSGLDQLQNLAQISDISELANVISNSEVVNQLMESLNLGATTQQVTEAIAAVTGALSQVQGSPQRLASAIVEQLQNIAPELVAALGESALTNAIAGALAGLLGGGDEAPANEWEAADGCGANCPSCSDCIPRIFENHRSIRDHTTSEFEKHRIWIINDFFLENILPALKLMTVQLTATGIQQVQIIGGFFDAKHQLETQRLFQTLTAQAHKDYHPSEGMCVIGTNTRSLAASERKANLTQIAFATRMMDRQLLSADGISTQGKSSDRKSRVKTFIEKFCNKNDGVGEYKKLCEGSTPDPAQINMDVNYTAAVDNKLTLEIDFTKDDTAGRTKDEENIFALSANLFGNEVLADISDTILATESHEPLAMADRYLDLRAVAAKRSVAQNSFAAITALKTEGDTQVAPYLKAILKEAGVNPDEIKERLGENPSYFAQMEVLTKDLYQNPSFYSNLYDKPVNIERKGAALQAIELMQDRDLYKSLLRSEAVLATLVETLLREEHNRISSDLGNLPARGETYE